MKDSFFTSPYIFSVIVRIVTFLSASVLMLGILYAYGCFQDFMDTTQLFVLKILVLFSVFSVITALIFLVFSICTVSFGHVPIAQCRSVFILISVFFVFTGIMAVFSLSVITVSRGF